MISQLEILSAQGEPILATVFVAKFRGDENFLAEFVDARDPEVSSDKKWVIIISTQFGCPVSCAMCDAGGNYKGDLTASEMLAQIDHVVSLHAKERLDRVQKFKVQFARMGEPALNPAVLEVLRELPRHYRPSALIPCVATTSPASSRKWFKELLEIRHSVYANADFQLQLSINSTNEKNRDHLMPLPKMSFRELADFSEKFYVKGKRKSALNFALTEGVEIDPKVIARNFSPEFCCIKITPLNPTVRSGETGLATALPHDAPEKADQLCIELGRLGFDVILSIGDARENAIGSNCGMAVRKIRTLTKTPSIF